MDWELRRCQVRIDRDAAIVMMLAQTRDGKVTKLVMRYSEFENHSMGKHHGEN